MARSGWACGVAVSGQCVLDQDGVVTRRRRAAPRLISDGDRTDRVASLELEGLFGKQDRELASAGLVARPPDTTRRGWPDAWGAHCGRTRKPRFVPRSQARTPDGFSSM